MAKIPRNDGIHDLPVKMMFIETTINNARNRPQKHSGTVQANIEGHKIHNRSKLIKYKKYYLNTLQTFSSGKVTCIKQKLKT